MLRVAGADEPEAAVLSGPEDEIVVTEQPECYPDVTGGEGGDIGADQYRRARRAGAQRSPHTHPEIAFALAESLDPDIPELCTMPGMVRRDRDPHSPAPIQHETTQQPRNHQPLETQRRDRADLARKAAFAGAETWRANEQDKGVPHQP